MSLYFTQNRPPINHTIKEFRSSKIKEQQKINYNVINYSIDELKALTFIISSYNRHTHSEIIHLKSLSNINSPKLLFHDNNHSDTLFMQPFNCLTFNHLVIEDLFLNLNENYIEKTAFFQTINQKLIKTEILYKISHEQLFQTQNHLFSLRKFLQKQLLNTFGDINTPEFIAFLIKQFQNLIFFSNQKNQKCALILQNLTQFKVSLNFRLSLIENKSKNDLLQTISLKNKNNYLNKIITDSSHKKALINNKYEEAKLINEENNLKISEIKQQIKNTELEIKKINNSYTEFSKEEFEKSDNLITNNKKIIKLIGERIQCKRNRLNDLKKHAHNSESTFETISNGESKITYKKKAFEISIKTTKESITKMQSINKQINENLTDKNKYLNNFISEKKNFNLEKEIQEKNDLNFKLLNELKLEKKQEAMKVYAKLDSENQLLKNKVKTVRLILEKLIQA